MKFLEFTSGIYGIYSSENDLLYIGAANDIRKRFHSEKTLLEKNMHQCTELQAYYNQDSDLRFVPLFYCHERKLEFNKFILTQAYRPMLNLPFRKNTAEPGDVPPVVKLLAQHFAGKLVLMNDIQKFLDKHEERINTVTLGKLINQYGLATKERNWTERGKQYYRFK